MYVYTRYNIQYNITYHTISNINIKTYTHRTDNI